MSEKKTADLPLADRFDVRLVSLYSRGVQDSMYQGFTGDNRFYSFSYYDAIEIQHVELGAGTVLKDAYALAHESSRSTCIPDGKEGERPAFCQVLVAMTDISKDSEGGYSQEKIDAFWSSEQEAPLFFISMLNMTSSSGMDRVLSEIKNVFPAGRHLAYITFDHCDIIIFSRGESFQEYTDCIFNLYYAGRVGLEDAITLYSFAANGQMPETEERFAALIRIGVKNYPSREDFYQRLAAAGGAETVEAFSKYWLLGRNDIAFYREDASLPWLAQVRNALIESEKDVQSPWYTTYDLMVLSQDKTDEDRSKWKPNLLSSDTSFLESHMRKLYEEFKDSYEAVHVRLQRNGVMVSSDQVWLRWLEKSCQLVVSLMSSRLSKDLAVCLLPQFMDLLEYGKRLFTQTEVEITRDGLETIHKGFRTFFSNVAVLVDSMNQTNRQFVQVPAFHLPSFEIPPQIMAYFTVVLRKMLQALKDKDTEIFYGFTISPKLVNTLSVSPIGMQDIQLKDEWISMNMDESSFYTLRLTTETLAHEVSHYVGETTRNREFRKECIIKCEFELLLNCLACRFAKEVDQVTAHLCDDPEKESTFHLLPAELRKASKTLWDAVQILDPELYAPETQNLSIEVEAVIWQLPQDILSDDFLRHAVIEQIWGLLYTSADSDARKLVGKLRRFVQWKLGLEEELPASEAGKALEAILAIEADDIFDDIISELASDLQYYHYHHTIIYEDIVCLQLDYLCHMFRETFADLQAIILLDMKWKDYCGLLLQGNSLPGADHTPRMYSVTKALMDCEIWGTNFSYGGAAFSQVRNALKLDFTSDGGKLADLDISPTLCFYLTEYLKKCARDIKESFSSNDSGIVCELQDIHRLLDDSTSLLDLQKEILFLTDKYRSKLLMGE